MRPPLNSALTTVDICVILKERGSYEAIDDDPKEEEHLMVTPEAREELEDAAAEAAENYAWLRDQVNAGRFKCFVKHIPAPVADAGAVA